MTGDVDSGEDAELYSELHHPYPLPIPSMHHIVHHHTNDNNSRTTPTASGSGGHLPPTPIASSTPTPTSPTEPQNLSHPGRARKIQNGRPRHKLHETKL